MSRVLEFDQNALEDLQWWMEQDRKKAVKIMDLIRKLPNQPFDGLGKPEPLKHNLAGAWSRRIDEGNRLVYQVTNDKIRILSCRYHY